MLSSEYNHPRVALLILTSDGGMQAIKRVRVLNRKIGTIGNAGSGSKFSPGASTQFVPDRVGLRMFLSEVA